MAEEQQKTEGQPPGDLFFQVKKTKKQSHGWSQAHKRSTMNQEWRELLLDTDPIEETKILISTAMCLAKSFPQINIPL